MTPVDPHIFRAYDIRGDVRTQLTPAVVRDIGAALADAHFPPSSTLAVACDARTHSPALVQALIEGLTRQGVNVVNYGQTTTPMLYFALHQHGHDGGVMVTGSHNPIFDNGLKICRKTSSFVSDDIQAIWARLSSPIAPADRPGSLSESEILDDYREAIVSRVSLSGRIRVVVDGGNGVAGPFALDILSALGAGVEPLFCEPDGSFPNHHPDPSVPKNLESARQLLLECSADLALAFDGDGDRLGVIDKTGKIIEADHLLTLFAREVLAHEPGATIIGDVKCSKFTFDDIANHGGKPMMAKTGHALIKAAMRQTGASLAGEMSGHFFFASRWFGFDDAIYAAARLIEIVSRGVSLAEMLADWPKTCATPELRLPCPDDLKFELAQAMADEYARRYPTNTMDGARIDFPEGWALVRASNTQPILVLRVEAASPQAVTHILNDLRQHLTAFAESRSFAFDFACLDEH